jgi:hypothetical protein
MYFKNHPIKFSNFLKVYLTTTLNSKVCATAMFLFLISGKINVPNIRENRSNFSNSAISAHANAIIPWAGDLINLPSFLMKQKKDKRSNLSNYLDVKEINI